MQTPAAAPRRINSRVARLALAALAVAALAAAATAFTRWSPLTVTAAAPERNVVVQVYGLGTLEARILSEVGVEVGAAVAELAADHGDRVRKGQVLARLHSAEQEAKVARARAGIVNAEAGLEAARAAASKADAILAHRKSVSDRRQALLGRQVTSVEAAADAEKEVVVAEAEVATARSGVAVALAHLEDAKAQLEFERVLLDHHVLRAPYDALVVKRHKELGAVMKAGETLFTLIDPASVWALAYVDEARTGDLVVGQPAEIRMRSRPREPLKGRVVRIGIESDRVSEERRVYVSCEPCPETFHLGEQVEVLVTTGTLAEATLIPDRAAQGFDGITGRVWTLEGGRLKRRTLDLGPRTLDGRIAVRSALEPGVRVLTEVPAGAREGRSARLAAGAVR